MSSLYYVYEHWRPDTDMCFYVGRGKGRRASRLKGRNEHHKRIVAKLVRLGMCVEVRMYASGLTYDEALAKERERVSFWRELGVDIVNQTAGGDGVPDPTDEVRSKMSNAHQTRWTPERRDQMAAKTRAWWSNPDFRTRVTKALKTRKISAQHLANLTAGNIRSWNDGDRREKQARANAGEGNPFFGKRHLPEILARIAAKKRGTKMTPEAREKMCAAQRARREREMAAKPPREPKTPYAPRKGYKHAPETIERMRAAAKKRGISQVTRDAAIKALTGRHRVPHRPESKELMRIAALEREARRRAAKVA